ncbi:DUF5313 family protein [Actinophytocola sp.]|jgi:hypothetical protein|uniref:DUF5313 family protein n=1 Tax=Actinophytocola sp. TaxID=1872138 RepID=UPI002ED937BA
MRRPDPAHWLWYAVGGTLPAAYHEWVLYDLTCGTWVFRHLARVQVLFAPWWLALLVPGPLSLRLSMVALGYLLSLYFSLSFMEDACERRLVKHGFPPGLNRTIREESSVDQRAELAAIYAAYYRH